MHGAGDDEGGKRRRRMLPGPTPPLADATATATATADSPKDSDGYFVKGGRKIQVGDCALFQSGNAPPFIGIIRWFTTSKENHLKLCVNWLYRPADVKLVKGISLEAAPNEVFYSFHRDEIPAASLLHPCKVAFLRRGVELPSGLLSFVCRRVYDIENKCLWWLTDQDYINERQEEVDKLLDRTRLEMHAFQSGGRSVKALSGPAPTQQLKPSSENVQNSGSSFSPQVKGKKRERGDQGTESIKRDRNTKVDDGDSVSRLDNMIKAEISKITEKGGLVNIEGVEKLVHLMQLDRAERKIDLASRTLLADVIAATDRLECLRCFVQLRGVPVLDDWLQEAHKGKTGDGNSPKEGDKSVEDLLLSLLRALDKLPVNLNALQTCNIGKSVNHLRGHKNLDIQKKARSLIDTWKKRVDAEMTKINDAKPVGSCQVVSWPAKQGFPDVSHGGNRRLGSTDTISRSSTIQPSTCKAQPSKTGDSTVKSPSVTSGPSKSPSTLPPSPVTISSKESLSKATGGTGTPEFFQMTLKEEKNNNSGHSQNNNQSSFTDHAKVISSSWKEEPKSSNAGSVSTSKTIGGSSRHRRSSNGLVATTVSGVSKDSYVVKPGSLNKTTTIDKASMSGLACEKMLDGAPVDHGNSHRLIVRLPNPGRSPARSANGGSFEDPIVGSRASSPGEHDKHEQIDRRMKVRTDACRPNVATNVSAESCHGIDGNEGLVESNEIDKVQGGTHQEEHYGNADEMGMTTDTSRTSGSLSGNGKEVLLAGSKTKGSFSSINALIESCAKFSEPSASLTSGDDIGMNLLATVAAGEMSKSNLVSPAGSPRSSLVGEEPCPGNSVVKLGPACEDVAQNYIEPNNTGDSESEKHGMSVVSMPIDELQKTGDGVSGDEKNIASLGETKMNSEQTELYPDTNLHKSADLGLKSEKKIDEERANRSTFSSTHQAEVKAESEGQGTQELQNTWKATGQKTDSLTEYKPPIRSPSCDENKLNGLVQEHIEEGGRFNVNSSDKKVEVVAKGSQCFPSSDMDVSTQSVADDGLSASMLTEQQVPPAAADDQDTNDRSGGDAGAPPGAVNAIFPENVGGSKTEKVNRVIRPHMEPSDSEKREKPCFAASTVDNQAGSVPCTHRTEEDLEAKEAPVHCSAGLSNHQERSTIPVHETEKHEKSSGPKSDFNLHGVEDNASFSVAASAVSAEQDIASKLDFDLNEGFPGDDGNQGEPITSAAPVHSSAVHLHGLPPFVASPVTNALRALITVAAPAKGPFVPPETLLKSKAEPGWKGSAATSAFRPAEPRKVLEMPISTPDTPLSDTNSGKQGRPAFDIDLNVPDERALEDMTSQSSAQTAGSESGAISKRDAPIRMTGALDLDLNKVDEGVENGLFFASSRKMEVPLIPIRPISEGFPNGESSMSRGFDLNGPGLDEVGTEPNIRSQQTKGSSMPLLPPFAGLRMSHAELGNMSSWFPPGNSYPAVAIPSFLPDRGEQNYPIVRATAGSQRVLGPATSGSNFGSDIYRGSMLSSSPAMTFSHSTALPYAGFPFGSSFPLVSTSLSGGLANYVDSSSGSGQCFSTIPSQLVGPAGVVSTHYRRPYLVNLPEGGASAGSESSQKWSRHVLDLNAGPGSADVEGREDRLTSVTRQLPVASSQAFTEEQARIYQLASGGLKRKEPDGGWDADRYTYKQPPWQ